jgi:hypothetical protein
MSGADVFIGPPACGRTIMEEMAMSMQRLGALALVAVLLSVPLCVDAKVPPAPTDRPVVRPPMMEYVSPVTARKAVGQDDASNRAPLDTTLLASHGGPHAAVGTLRCDGQPLPFVKVVVAGQGAQTLADGSFRIEQSFRGVPNSVFIAFEGNAAIGALQLPLQIFDDVHVTRSERVDRTPVVTGTNANFGTIAVPGTDCRLWRFGLDALTHYVGVMSAAPPAGGLRIKRWTAVPMSVGSAHTFHDHIVAPTNLADSAGARGTILHEFGHTIAFVADGAKTHWDWDNTRFIYARVHNDQTVMNKGTAFIEGWAKYWQAAAEGSAIADNSGLSADFLDFNENQIAIRLMDMANAAPTRHAFMVRLFINNPGQLHTLEQYERRYCATAPAPNRFCRRGRPVRSAPSCPIGYNDDGATCRLNNILSKPSQGRGVGTVPNQCGAGRQLDAGLCYPLCPAGFRGVGPVCWETCPAGYNDDGATCRRDGSIIGSDNNACPWYDKCGLVSARGCSVCPPGYNNDGCTCRRDPHIFGKRSQGRGVGTVPNGCAAGRQMDAGLCYAACPAGFNGVGPVCWGTCPAGFADHGATCYRAPHIFSDDPVIPP